MLSPLGSVNSPGIGPTTPVPPTPPGFAIGAAGASSESSSPSFKNMLLDSVQQVNSMQLEANRAVEGLFTGAEVNPAEVLTAVQKADLAFRMLMQVRNKLVAAYQEIKDVKV
jgi:flagellar hook-basal body complex protein FliE